MIRATTAATIRLVEEAALVRLRRPEEHHTRGLQPVHDNKSNKKKKNHHNDDNGNNNHNNTNNNNNNTNITNINNNNARRLEPIRDGEVVI